MPKPQAYDSTLANAELINTETPLATSPMVYTIKKYNKR